MDEDTAPQPVPPIAKAGVSPLALEVRTVTGHHGGLKHDQGWQQLDLKVAAKDAEDA